MSSTITSVGEMSQRIASKKGRVEEEDLKQAGLSPDLKKQADTDQNGELSAEELTAYLVQNGNGLTIIYGGRTYVIDHGKLALKADERAAPGERVKEAAEDKNKEVLPPDVRLFIKLMRLSGYQITDKEKCEQWLNKIKITENGQVLIVVDKEFRKGLADLLRVELSEVTEVAVNAIFRELGPDGKLSSQNKISPADFEARVDEATNFFSVKRGGIIPFLRKKEVHILNAAGLQAGWQASNFIKLIIADTTALNRFENEYLQRAEQAWIQLARSEAGLSGQEIEDKVRDRQRVIDDFRKGDRQPLLEEQELTNLIFYAYLDDFERYCATRTGKGGDENRIKIASNITWSKPKTVENFLNGVFLNYVLNGRVLPDDQNKITEAVLEKTVGKMADQKATLAKKSPAENANNKAAPVGHKTAS